MSIIKNGMHDSLKIRPAGVSDLPFLSDMIFEAGAASEAFRKMGKKKTLTLPAVIYFLENFGRDGDFGFIAELDGKPVGAAWARLFSEEQKSYGFISTEIPEFAIAVVPELRASGVGTKLMERLLEEARNLKIPALSLSVYRSNPALRLYERFGFCDAGISKETDSSVVMILKF
jgi:ribosomal protein S18 acetylase RimI-like enzyme